MTRIDFHSNVADKIAYACRLVRKARAAHCNAVVIGSDRRQLDMLDEALWTFSDQDFLPHVMADDALAAQTPVILATNETTEFPHYQVLINLAPETPTQFARFERMLEIVSADAEDKTAGRDRYRFYQQRGYPLTHFVAEST